MYSNESGAENPIEYLRFSVLTTISNDEYISFSRAEEIATVAKWQGKKSTRQGKPVATKGILRVVIERYIVNSTF